MAITQTHFRSISLPTRLPSNTPTSSKSQVKRLKSLQNVNTVGSSSQDIQSGLVELANVYTSVQELNQFSASEQSLYLDGSVELIDSCNNIREMFQMIKENVQSLQSAIRRKGVESSSIQDDISAYLCFRKKMNKNLSKSLKSLRNLENKTLLVSADSTDSLVMALREAIATFRSILMYLSCPVAKSGSWNLISRLMVTKAEASVKDHCVTSEVERLDCALAAKVLDGLTVQSSLQELDSCTEGIEAGLETVYKKIIRCRVKILNILADY